MMNGNKKKYPLLIDTCPELLKEWNHEKNKDICDIEKVTLGSSRKVWWKCEKGHEWETRIVSRTKNGTRCPICSGSKILAGFNDLQTQRPDLMKEWNYRKNTNIDPSTMALRTNKKVWWKCLKGHEWEATIASRTEGIGCPICSGNKVWAGYNDLETKNPELVKEWDYKKNKTLTPQNVTQFSSKKVWWKCERGHSWKATVAGRSSGNGCPRCSKVLKTSFPEQAISYYLSKAFIIDNRIKINGWEADIYLVEYCLAIEYDGVLYHEKDIVKKREQKKKKAFEDVGVELVRVVETWDRKDEDDSIIYFIADSQYINLDNAIERLLALLSAKLSMSVSININTKRDSLLIKKEYLECIKKNSLASKCPELAKEWDLENNYGLLPESFTAYSSEKVWWKCSKGHSYQATINNRRNGDACPYCSGHQVLKGFNDFETKNPELAKEWLYEKNYPLLPSDVTSFSMKKVWWICKNGHEYVADIAHRSAGRNCPYCSGRKVKQGYNDLGTVNPKLAREWNFVKNGDLRPTEITANNNRKVWWQCSKGHEWTATVASRNNGIGCPICSGKKVLSGYNDLATLNPKLAREWNYEKNGDLLPSNVRPHNMKKVWWKCEKGHEWCASIDHRSYGSGCPQCYYERLRKKNKD